MKHAFVFVVILAVAVSVAGAEDFTSVARAHTYEFTVDEGRLGGPGADFLEEATAGTQFVLLGEPHNLKEVPLFTSALFAALHEGQGYQYAALETGVYAMERAGAAARAGGEEALTEFFAAYPYSFQFFTDQELAMMSSIATTSTAKVAPLWGVDQVHSETLVLDRLIELAPTDALREDVKKIAFAANMYNENRGRGERIYLLQDTDAFDRLAVAFASAGPPEAAFLAEQLRRSYQVYKDYRDAEAGKATGYRSNTSREENMKFVFMHQYRAAVVAGDPMPKVLAKMGHWHILRGQAGSNAFTFGNFLHEFATSNGMGTFSMAISIVNEPRRLWSLSDDEEYRPLTDVTSPGKNVIVDVRPLRALAHAGQLEGLTAKLRDWVYQYDAVVLIGGATRGTYSTPVQTKRLMN